MTQEQWKPVREFPDHYEISSRGRLKRTHAYHPNQVGKIRKPQITKKGYVVYMLSVENKPRLRSAHRMVADAFLGPIPKGMEVNHIDGDKANPRLENLEIVTNSENRAHSYRELGVPPNVKVENNGNAKLNYKKANEIRAALKGGAGFRELADRYGVNPMTIRRIHKNKAWRDEHRPATP